MKLYICFILLKLTVSLGAQSQHYAGKFMNKRSLTDFRQFIVMQDTQSGLQSQVVNVRAFDSHGELWHSVASHAKSDIIAEVLSNFGKDHDIVSVYKLDLDHNGEIMHYYMIGHRDYAGKEQFFLVEEYFHGPEDIVDVEVNTFVWSHATVRN